MRNGSRGELHLQGLRGIPIVSPHLISKSSSHHTPRDTFHEGTRKMDGFAGRSQEAVQLAPLGPRVRSSDFKRDRGLAAVLAVSVEWVELRLQLALRAGCTGRPSMQPGQAQVHRLSQQWPQNHSWSDTYERIACLHRPPRSLRHSHCIKLLLPLPSRTAASSEAG